jgi:hypothetical protein
LAFEPGNSSLIGIPGDRLSHPSLPIDYVEQTDILLKIFSAEANIVKSNEVRRGSCP